MMRDGSNRLAAALLFALAAAAAPVQAQDLDATARQRLFYTVKPAVVLIKAMATANITLQTDDGVMPMRSMEGSGGSGWIISADGYVVTNGHVVELFHASNEDRLKGTLFFRALQQDYFPALEKRAGRQLTEEEKYQIARQLLPRAQIELKKDLSVILQNRKELPAEVKEYSAPITPMPGKYSGPWATLDAGKDVAILKVEARDLPTVRIGDSETVQIGDDVFPAGYPAVVMQHPWLDQRKAEEETSFTRGQVSSVKLDVKGMNVLQIDAATSYGNSGGPVFSAKGEVIGMATFCSLDLQRGGIAVQGFNFAVPSNTVLEFIRATGVVMDPGTFDRIWARALDDYYAGRYQEAVVGLEQALRFMPDLPDAIKLRREALLVIESQPDAPVATRLPIWLFGVLGVGAVLLVGGVTVRRRGLRTVTVSARPAGQRVGTLVVTEGPLRGNHFPISRAGLRIGRDDASCQIVLTESTVSREHAMIAPVNGGIRIRNLSGTNPTFVNGRSVDEAELAEGDLIRIGNSVITYEKD
jgi:serine protease Do